MGTDAVQAALAYHARTKHHFHRYAQSLGYLDWKTQPDPFRRYEGAEAIPLRFANAESWLTYDELWLQVSRPAEPVSFATLSSLFEWSLALSAWKEFRGSRWALRVNPSSGNLHPTEGYLVVGSVEGLSNPPGVFHYAPRDHALELRTSFDESLWSRLIDGFPARAFLIGLTSIHWREAWKYGERAYRYCQHDVGHAVACVAISAAIHGWRCMSLNGLADSEIASLLGLDRDADFLNGEREEPDLILAIIPEETPDRKSPNRISADAIQAISSGVWTGRANRLSESHQDWPIIEQTAAACRKLAPLSGMCGELAENPPKELGLLPPDERRALPASKIIRQRRSAVSFDGRTKIHADQFYLMLDRVMPRYDRVPWSAQGRPTCVHLAIFLHRVDPLEPGLYFLVRDLARLAEIRGTLNPQFAWEKPAGCPGSLPLYMLASGDTRTIATNLSCHQEIAGDSAFSLGMLAELDGPLREFGAWFYRRLFWETGVIGQVLYLEAEAAGVRATGIGCFFDDPVHNLLGIHTTAMQSLYHFTVGGPVEDTRLTTLPAYSPEQRANRYEE